MLYDISDGNCETFFCVFCGKGAGVVLKIKLLKVINGLKGCEYMLSIYFGNYSGENYIENPDLYFDNTYQDEWLEDERSKEMVMDVDRSELVSPNLVISPVLGSIPVNRLSGGVKTLIQIDHDSEHVYNASACGDNCAGWLLKIGQEKEILVRLGHIMHFEEMNTNDATDMTPFRIRIANTDDIVTSQSDLVKKVLLAGLLDGEDR